MIPRGRRATAALLLGLPVLGLLLLLPGDTAAHGVLERSYPPPGASVTTAPTEVLLWFSEPVDPTLSTGSVTDASGRKVSGRAAVGEGGRSLIVPVEAAGEGVYTVVWQVLSTVDGHLTRGAFLFAVGTTVPGAGPTVETAAQADPPDPLSVAARWVAFAAAMLLAGSVFFALLVHGPALRRVGEDPPVERHLHHLQRRLRVGGAVALLIAVAVEFLLTAGSLIEGSLPRAVAEGRLWPLLFGTKTGWSALARWGGALLFLAPTTGRGRVAQSGTLLLGVGAMGVFAFYQSVTALAAPSHSLHLLFVLLIALGYGLVAAVRRPPQVDWVSAVIAAGLLAGFTVNSHAAGGGATAAAADRIHLTAAAIWVGGVASLFLAVRLYRSGASQGSGRAAEALPAIVARFSAWAGVSLGVLVVTGLYASWLHVPSLPDVLGTPYGRALAIKVGLVVLLALLGALNHFVFRPKAATASETAPPRLARFLRAVTGEVGVGALVLLAVAVLTILPPASAVAPSARREPLRLAGLTATTAEVRAQLTITPAQPGFNAYEAEVRVSDAPLAPPGRVLLRLTHLESDLTPVLLRLEEQAAGRFAASGGELALAGWWEIQLSIRRPGQPDQVTAFPILIGDPPARAEEPEAAALLARARIAGATLKGWRQSEQITDGRGGAVLTDFTFVPPDRMHYRTSSGQEVIVVGTRRFVRQDGQWEEDALPGALALGGGDPSLQDAQRARFGRDAECEEEPCRVVLWEAPAGAAAYAGWFGTRSGRLYRLLMVAPSHYMTVRLFDFDAPIRITPP